MRQGHSGIVEFTALRKDGSTFPAELSTVVFRDAYGKPEGFVTSKRDISQRKKVQEQLKSLYDAEQKIRYALEAQLRKRADFFRAVVHELKTPLTPVVVSSENILDLMQE